MLELNIENKIVLRICDVLDLERNPERNCYKIMHILEGSGMSFMNEITWNYEEGSFFIIAPGKEISFIPQYQSKILIVSYTNSLITLNLPEHRVQDLRDLFKLGWYDQALQSFEQGKKIGDEADAAIITSLVNILSTEMHRSTLFSTEILLNVVCSMTLIFARNSTGRSTYKEPVNYDIETETLLGYVKFRVREDKKVTITGIANGLNMTYYNLNKAVIKGTGITLKSHISRYKKEISRGRLVEV